MFASGHRQPAGRRDPPGRSSWSRSSASTGSWRCSRWGRRRCCSASRAFFRRWVRDAFRDIRVRLARMNAFLQEHISGMKVVQAFAQEAQVDRRLRRHQRRLPAGQLARHRRRRRAVFDRRGGGRRSPIAGLLWHGGNRIAGGTLTFGVLVAFIEYLGKFFAPIRDLSTKYTVMQQAMAAAERVFTLLDTTEPDAPAAPRARASSLAGARRGRGLVYRARPRHLRLPRRSAGAARRVAVDRDRRDPGHRRRDRRGQVDDHQAAAAPLRRAGAARSASTASTSATLDARGAAQADRRRQPGRVHVRRHAAREHRPRRRRLDDERILRGRPPRRRRSRDRHRARRAGRAACSNAARTSPPASASWSRFARALAREPEILILDEATASVDPETERVIERGIAELMRGRTSIVIAHRLSTVQRASRIVVIHHGRIAEQGTHDALLAGRAASTPASTVCRWSGTPRRCMRRPNSGQTSGRASKSDVFPVSFAVLACMTVPFRDLRAARLADEVETSSTSRRSSPSRSATRAPTRSGCRRSAFRPSTGG